MSDDGDAFYGSQADLEGAAENLFSSPPSPQPRRFESLSLKTPQTVPGTALQNKIDSRIKQKTNAEVIVVTDKVPFIPNIYRVGPYTVVMLYTIVFRQSKCAISSEAGELI